MTNTLLLASSIANIFLLLALVMVSSDRRNLQEQIRWLQQQVELFQRDRERDTQFSANAPNGVLVLLLVIAAIGVLIAFLSRRG